MALPSVAQPAYTDVPIAIQLQEQRIPKAVVQFMRRSHLYYLLDRAGDKLNIRGPNVQVPFFTTEPLYGKWISYDDKLPDGEDVKPEMGYATQRYIVVPITHNILRQWENMGNPTKLWDDVEMAVSQATWGLRTSMCNGFWSGPGGKEPDGLSTMIEAAAPASQTATVTGVSKASKAWARNPVVQLTTNFGHLAANTRIPAGFIAMDSLISQCTISTIRPTDLVTTKSVFDTVVRAVKETRGDARRIMTKREHFELGIESIEYDGCMVGWDTNCPDDKMYALHIGTNYQPAVVNHQDHGAKYDPDLELSGGKHRFLELESSIAILQHPDIMMRAIDPRVTFRGLRTSRWMVTSGNLFMTRPRENGVLYSDNGSRLSTW